MRRLPLTKNREVIYDLLTRAKRFHCPVSGTWELDAGPLAAARAAARAQGRAIGLAAPLVKATALVLERHPRLNRHLFHGLFRRFEVDFEAIRCTLILLREGPDGERMLFPLNVDQPERRSVDEIQALIDHHKRAPLAELPQVQAIQRLKRMPRPLLRWFSWKARSDPAFYLRYFGTYGVSCVGSSPTGPIAGHAVANTGSAFFVGPVREAPRVVDGRVSIGLTLSISLVVDHYLLDGNDMVAAMDTLRALLLEPTRLGLPAAPVPADLTALVAGEEEA